MTPITEYKEQDVEWAGSDIGAPPLGVMFVFCDNGVPKMVNFLCPCGCGNLCPTHLATPDRPKQPNDRRWNFSRGPNGPTLDPSIRWTSGCRSHFTITDGKVKMEG